MTREKKPPLRMVVGPGKLTPADPYSEEMLDKFRVGSEVECRISLEFTARKIRRYWAILRRVIESCQTPWASTDEADQALKLACGNTRQMKTLSGRILRYPGSLNDLGEDFDDFFEHAMAVLTRITGVDPLTLWKDEDEGTPSRNSESPGYCSPPGDERQRAPKPPRVETAVGPSADVAHAASAAANKREAIQKISALARDEQVSIEQRLETLRGATLRAAWDDRLPNDAGFLDAVFSTIEKMMRGELPQAAALSYLQSLIREDS